MTIDSASITFRARSNESGNCDLTFVCEDEDNAGIYLNNTFEISTRSYTSASVDWIDVPDWANNNFYTTPNLAGIVQEVINRPGWSSGNAMAFGVTGTDRREADSRNGSNADAPLLYISYDSVSLFFVLEVDTNTVPQPDYDLVTPNVIPISFTAAPEASCSNDFGFFNRDGLWPLPLNITEFDARLLSTGSAELEWRVDSEIGTVAYEVEKAPDAISFEPIYFVEAVSGLAEPLTYKMMDPFPF